MKQACESWALELTYLLIYFLIFNPCSLNVTLQDAKIMLIKTHLKGYRTAHLQIYKWLMYTHNIIQKILEKTNKQTNKQKQNKNKYNAILKKRFHG